MDVTNNQQSEANTLMSYEETPQEAEYRRRLKSGEDMGDLKAPPMIVQSDRALWESFDAYHQQLANARHRVMEWYNERLKNGYGIILAGNCGSGKTHLAKAIRDIHVLRVKYWSEIDLIKMIQKSFGNKESKSKAEILLEIDRVELFILDDLGAYETDNDQWMQTIYMDLFDARCDAKKPWLVTTNLNKDRLFNRVGDRVASRLLGGIGDRRFFVELFDVPDYRIKDY